MSSSSQHIDGQLEFFDQVVLNGLLAWRGMQRWNAVLDSSQAYALLAELHCIRFSRWLFLPKENPDCTPSALS